MASAPGFDPNDLSSADPDALGNPAAPGRLRARLHQQGDVHGGGTGGGQAATPRTKVTVPNRLKRADRLFADDVDHETWHLTLNGVLAKSSNIGTILATEQLGDTQRQANRVLHRYLRKFGIGRPTGLGLPR